MREAYCVALEAAQRGRLRGSVVERIRDWKLFLLIPRMLLHKPVGTQHIPKAVFVERFKSFNEGKWKDLLTECTILEGRRGSIHSDLERRVARAGKLVALGEISSARQALEAAEIAPGNVFTLNSLTNTDRRPDVPRSPLPESISTFVPATTLPLEKERFIKNLRCARKGASGGPTGMTAEHLKVCLSSGPCLELLYQLGQEIVEANFPPDCWMVLV